MYNHVLVNAGVGEAYWLDSAAQQRCFEFLLSQTKYPNLLKVHFCLSGILECKKSIEYWTVEGKLKMIEKVKADGAVVSDWGQVFSFVDNHVVYMKEKMQILEHAAARFYQKACPEGQVNTTI